MIYFCPALWFVETGRNALRSNILRRDHRVLDVTIPEVVSCKSYWEAIARFMCWLVLLFNLGKSASLASEPYSESMCITIPAEVTIDQVWGGARVRFSSVENRNFIYVAYFDRERWLSVAQINKCTGKEERISLPSQFGGWDSHNSISLILDEANRLHVAGNMHVSPLVYARMDVPDQLAGLSELRAMTGTDEARTTYPYFFRFGDGALGFSYRSGRSGDGAELINRLDGSRWVRWAETPLFAADSMQSSVNAYHSGYVVGPDNYFHAAWVWRAPGGVEKNFGVNYAKSKDLRTWLDSNGKRMALPMTPATSEVVDAVPKGSGLLNNLRLGFDKAGRPVISYLKFDAAGATQLFHARRGAAGWQVMPATEWKYRWDPRGGGTISNKISFTGVAVRGGRLIEQVRHPEFGVKALEYADDSLKVLRVLGTDAWAAAFPVKNRPTPPGAVLNTGPVQADKALAVQLQYRRAISWFSHPADNRDRPRKCIPVGLPCDFSSKLILHSVPASPGALK